MKNLIMGIIITLIVLVLVGTTVAMAMPEQAANGDNAKAPDLEKIEFIHWKKDFAKPETARGPKTPTCYKLLKPTTKWVGLPVSYVINPTNSQGLSESFISSAVSTASETWDLATSKELMNNVYTIDPNANYGVQDYKNSISFGNYGQTGVIAVTSIWRNTMTKAIVEFDMMFDIDYMWGDAIANPALMDLQNIATHELGHAVGLDDIYQSSCSTVTMYGYSSNGDVGKRALELPDITGLIELYGP